MHDKRLITRESNGGPYQNRGRTKDRVLNTFIDFAKDEEAYRDPDEEIAAKILLQKDSSKAKAPYQEGDFVVGGIDYSRSQNNIQPALCYKKIYKF